MKSLALCLFLLFCTSMAYAGQPNILRVVVKGPGVVNRVGEGKGPDDLPCNTRCDFKTDPGSNVHLIAEPEAGNRFVKWKFPKGVLDDSNCGANPSCSIFIEKNRAVQAVFIPINHSLRVTREGSGKGNVTSFPIGIDCGKKCTLIETPHAEVTLTATPEGQSKFAGWGGACAGQTEATCKATLKPAKEGITAVSVRFE